MTICNSVYARILIIISIFFLTGCNGNSSICSNVDPVVSPGDAFFEGAIQNFIELPNSNNLVGLSCHNCYLDDSQEAHKTISIIESSFSNGASLVELDVIFSDAPDKAAYISHEIGLFGPRLEDVLKDEVLTESSQILFIEIKGQVSEKEPIRKFFDVLMQQSSKLEQYAFLNAQRFTVVRSIDNRETLSLFEQVVQEEQFRNIKNFVKFSRLFYPNTEDAMINHINNAYNCGFHMVELDTRLGGDSILSLSQYARVLGLGVGVYTLGEENAKNLVTQLKHDIDVFTIEDQTSDKSYGESLINFIQQLLGD